MGGGLKNLCFISSDNGGQIWYIFHCKHCLFDCRKKGIVKQSNKWKNRDKTAFFYERLSRDDNKDGESYSIGNPVPARAAKRTRITGTIPP